MKRIITLKYRIQLRLNKFSLAVGMLSIVFVNNLVAQDGKEITKVGTTVGQFLKIEVTPRAAALGGTFSSIANDASALYWNVAGIAEIHHNELLLAHTNWLADLKYEFGGVVVPLGDVGTMGVTVMSMGTEMDVRTVEQPEGTGEKFVVSNLAVGVSYARSLTDKFSIGFTGKYIRETIWHMNASTFAVDMGTLYRTHYHGVTLGMSITNFGGKMKFEGRDAIAYINVNPGKNGSNDKVVSDIRIDEWSLPLVFRVGLSAEPIANDLHRLTIAVDALHPNDNTESVNVGAEYVFEDFVSLRGGYKALFRRDSEEGLTLGGGIKYVLGNNDITIDYSWSAFGRLISVQRMSLGIVF